MRNIASNVSYLSKHTQYESLSWSTEAREVVSIEKTIYFFSIYGVYLLQMPLVMAG